MAPASTAKDILERFRRAWDELPGQIVDISIISPDETDIGYDARIHINTPQGSIDLIVEIKSKIFPKDVRDIRWRLQGIAGRISSSDVVPMIMADAISPGAREEMRREGIAYFEAKDSFFIPARAMYVLVERPKSRSQPKAMTTIFEGQRAMVLHAVWSSLSAAEPWFNVQDIARNSGASVGTVSETLTELERRDWVDSVGSGPSKLRRLADPTSLLDDWSQYQSYQKPPQMDYYYVPGAKAGDILDHLRRSAMDYEVTGEVAGQAYAPYLTAVSQVTARYAHGLFIQGFLRETNALQVRDGWNLGLMAVPHSDNPFRFRERVDGIYYASPLQTYLDLLNGPGRSKDLAHHLREQVLRQ